MRLLDISLGLGFFLSLKPVLAATAEQWRNRSIYQIIVDRYALPEGANTAACNASAQTWCGGTWNTIRENLDYVQDMGFTAIWISPISQNYEGARTAYGDAYHGYWIADVSKLNDKFGTADDLTALITEVHRRDMYIMVDVVVNDVMSTSTTPDYSSYLFTDAEYYHPYCPIDWSNDTSIEHCWLGDTVVPLPDLDTENPTVISTYSSWISSLVSTYNIDGLRIDAAKHVQLSFWPTFCSAAGVFCIGEVFSGVSDVSDVALFQGADALDSVLNYPMYGALAEAFAIPGSKNVTALQETFEQGKAQYKDLTVLGNFLENQDLSRWRGFSVDIQSLHNAMAFTFMSDGIPIVYYGQEQGFTGTGDPLNREPLWTSNYSLSETLNYTTQLNQLRNYLINSTSGDWATEPTGILTVSEYGLAIQKGSVITIMTNIGSPPSSDAQITVQTSFDAGTSTINILSCTQYAVGSNGYVYVSYTNGGNPVILVPASILQGSDICMDEMNSTIYTPSIAQNVNNEATHLGVSVALGLLIMGFLCVL